jgi:tetratricopeptide (TPR) repeat protein
MQRVLGTSAVALKLGFITAGCGAFTYVVDLHDGTELLDEGRYEETVGAFTRVFETDPPKSQLETAYWRRSLALYELDRLEDALADEAVLLDLIDDNPNVLAVAHLNRSREFAELVGCDLGRPLMHGRRICV